MSYDFAGFLDVKRKLDNELHARCPFHDDSSPSFSANTKTGLWICHAGCGQGNFSQFLQMLGNVPLANIRYSRNRQSKKYLRDEGFRTVTTYQYMATDGEYHLRVTRQEKSTGVKRFYQEHTDNNGKWVKGGATKDLCPYLIHEWCDSSVELVFLVEGEKCAEFLRSKGLKATTVAGGANKWLSHYGKFFREKRVIILPDNDDAGWKFASNAYRTLILEKTVSASILQLPNLNVGEDVVEWLSQHGTVDDLLKLIKLPDKPNPHV